MRILLIEDEQSIIKLLKSGLETESFVVVVAEDGQEGSFLARTGEYDLIILDNILPKKCGVEVLQEIRSEGKTMPVIILSVKSDTTTKIALLNAGADDYLIKPFSFEELMARIRALLRRPRQMEGEVYHADDLTLDTKRQIVTIAKKPIYLTRKEFTLLEYLMKNLGTVLSRGMIMEHVWNIDVDPFSNTIEAHILSLRRKLDVPGKKKLIQTVPGRGYKIDSK